MMKRNEWEEFFDNHAPVYMDNDFTKNTTEKVDFILDILKLPQGSCIIDIGCGTGRHAIELASRGYQLTGFDISAGMLAEAKKAAEEANVKVEWIHADATQFKSDKLFDAAICLCEGAFGLLGMSDDPFKHELSILRNIHAVLKSNGRIISTVLNGLATIRKYTQEDVNRGRFSPLSLTEVYTQEYDTPDGKKSILVKERGFVPSELVLLFRQTGFEVENTWGGTAGSWRRQTVNIDEIEVMIIARRKANNE